MGNEKIVGISESSQGKFRITGIMGTYNPRRIIRPDNTSPHDNMDDLYDNMH